MEAVKCLCCDTLLRAEGPHVCSGTLFEKVELPAETFCEQFGHDLSKNSMVDGTEKIIDVPSGDGEGHAESIVTYHVSDWVFKCTCCGLEKVVNVSEYIRSEPAY